MRLELEGLEGARAGLRTGSVKGVTGPLMSDFELWFRLVFRVDADELNPRLFERRYKKMAESRRPPRELLDRLLCLRNAARAQANCLTRAELEEFVVVMEQVIAIGDAANPNLDV